MGVHQSDDIYYQIKSILGIPPNEPIFILRAQDKYSVKTIQDYRKKVRDGVKPKNMGLNFHNWFSNVGSVINDFINWQRDNLDKVKVPD